MTKEFSFSTSLCVAHLWRISTKCATLGQLSLRSNRLTCIYDRWLLLIGAGNALDPESVHSASLFPRFVLQPALNYFFFPQNSTHRYLIKILWGKKNF